MITKTLKSPNKYLLIYHQSLPELRIKKYDHSVRQERILNAFCELSINETNKPFIQFYRIWQKLINTIQMFINFPLTIAIQSFNGNTLFGRRFGWL